MPTNRPDWWEGNQALRDELGLPRYEPSRLRCGAYLHQVVADLETTHGCEIDLVSHNPSYPSSWCVVVDGTTCVTMERHRDERGNNVYQVSAAELRENVERELG